MQGSGFFTAIFLQVAFVVWGFTAICMYCKLVRDSELRPVWIRYLLCGVAAAFGGTLPIVGYCALFMMLPWVAVLFLPILLLWAVIAIWRLPPAPF